MKECACSKQDKIKARPFPIVAIQVEDRKVYIEPIYKECGCGTLIHDIEKMESSAQYQYMMQVACDHIEKTSQVEDFVKTIMTPEGKLMDDFMNTSLNQERNEQNETI